MKDKRIINNSKKPKISVIMSVYNGMPYLPEAVKSILSQSYKNFEFIIVEDGSKDKSLEYLLSLRDSRIKIAKNKENIGLAASLNKGLRVAQGEYIARMDADDISRPHRLEIQLKFMKNNHKIDICGTFVEVIDEQGKVIGQIKKPKTDREIKEKIFWLTPILHPTWFAKSELFKKLNGYDDKWDYVEDFEFLARAKEFAMANIPNKLLLLRSQKQRRSQKTIQKIYKNSLKLRQKFFKEQNLGIKYIPILLRSYVATYIFPNWLKIYLNKILKFA